MCMPGHLEDTLDDRMIIDLRYDFMYWTIYLIYHLDDLTYWHGKLCDDSDSWLLNLVVANNDEMN